MNIIADIANTIIFYLPVFSLIISGCILFGLIFFLLKFNVFYIRLHKPEFESKRFGGEIVADVLRKHDVKFIFTLVGGHISPILVAAERNSIRVVDTRHEASAVFAADAVARLTGGIGVAAVTAGPGLTNTITAIKNCQMAETPVLLMGGAAASILKGRGALQDIDQIGLFKSLCKFSATVDTVRDIAPILRTAIQIAQSGTPGPVFVEFPIDVLYPYHLVKKEVGAKNESKGLMSKIVNWYLGNYVDNIFAGAWEQRDLAPLEPVIPLPSENQVQRSAEVISRAKRPLLLIGSQALLPPVSATELRKAVESLGIPSYLGGMARGLLGRNSPIQGRHERRSALKEADCVILLGSVCDFRLSYGRVLPKRASIIAVNRNASQLYKNSDMFWKPTIAVQADVGTFVKELASALKDNIVDPTWVDTIRKRDETREAEIAKMVAVQGETRLNPLKVLSELEKQIPDDAIIVADGGDFVGSAAYILRPRGPLSWLDPGAFGTLGVGGGFALGAKLARPDSEVWIIWGDGSSGYSLAEVEAMNRQNLPCLAVIGNDASWKQIAREQVPLFNTDVACSLSDECRYDKVAEGYGGKGFLADGKSNLEEVFKEARSMYTKEKCAIINALIEETKFREGSISV
ncbi:2-hydroxyacyl-CoA lyase 2-like [Artemia franciscana]|uniref:2-hydroxyacyl-CoA lyase 2-like n=1 Tax=Artemia franciscana TaxID=6661 RepID=UPI0032D9B429